MDPSAGLHAVPNRADGGKTPPAEDGPPTGMVSPTRRGGASRFLADVIVELEMLSKERVQKADEEARASGQTLETKTDGAPVSRSCNPPDDGGCRGGIW